jgi:hypothetical protein
MEFGPTPKRSVMNSSIEINKDCNEIVASSSRTFCIEFLLYNNKDSNGTWSSSSKALHNEFLIEINTDSNQHFGLPPTEHVGFIF